MGEGSEKFYQLPFPCKSCLVQACCMRGETLSRLHFENSTTLAVPKVDGKSYHKALIECWANLGFDIFIGTDYIKSFSGNVVLKHNIPVKIFSLMKDLSYLVQYMVNSTSWRNGKLEDFDIKEINEKLEVLKIK